MNSFFTVCGFVSLLIYASTTYARSVPEHRRCRGRRLYHLYHDSNEIEVERSSYEKSDIPLQKMSVLASIQELNKNAINDNPYLRHYFHDDPSNYNGDDALREHILRGHHHRVRRTPAYHHWLWPKDYERGIVEIPYQMLSTLTSVKETINTSFAIIEQATCIRFVPKTDNHKHYVNITHNSGCYATIGYVYGYPYEQMINLGSGCRTPGFGLHETLHTLGFDHTMTRLDRDKYVEIVWDNIRTNYKGQFEKTAYGITSVLGIDFLIDSIMNYAWDEFALVRDTHTIRLKSDRDAQFGGNREMWTEDDIEQVNRLYECDGYYKSEINR